MRNKPLHKRRMKKKLRLQRRALLSKERLDEQALRIWHRIHRRQRLVTLTKPRVGIH